MEKWMSGYSMPIDSIIDFSSWDISGETGVTIRTKDKEYNFEGEESAKIWMFLRGRVGL